MELPKAWSTLLETYLAGQTWKALEYSVEQAYRTQAVYPPRECLFRALERTEPGAVRAVILGQDPYHEPGQAMGLSFSVPKGTRLPPSLRNIYKELRADLGIDRGQNGDLTDWADQGVLLLNAVLTVRAGQALSHEKVGWQGFTDEIIRAVGSLDQPIAFVLWGNYARSKRGLIAENGPRLIVESAHPSPLSASRGFFGSRPFSRVNEFLQKSGEKEICWGPGEEPVHPA